MAQQTSNGHKRLRKMFGKIHEVAEMPNLIEVQKQSYDQFLMVEEPEGGRQDEGLQAVFRSVFPIKDFGERAQLEFVRYAFEPPKYDVEECQQRGMTYAAPLKVTLRLIVFDINEETGARSVKDIKEQDVYMGDMPLMTMNGTFVINGTERVIVSQMHRSPGVFFDHDRGNLGNLLVGTVAPPDEAVAVAADDDAVLQDDTVPDRYPLPDRNIRMDDAVGTNECTGPDRDIRKHHRVVADTGTLRDGDKRPD